MTALPILYDDFVPGTLLGKTVQKYDTDQARRWQCVFGNTSVPKAEKGGERASMAMINMMRGYLNIVTPRPPGNVHVRQQLKVLSLPKLEESIYIEVHCVAKEIRRERKYVELAVYGFNERGLTLFDAQLSLIWAA